MMELLHFIIYIALFIDEMFDIIGTTGWRPHVIFTVEYLVFEIANNFVGIHIHTRVDMCATAYVYECEVVDIRIRLGMHKLINNKNKFIILMEYDQIISVLDFNVCISIV